MKPNIVFIISDDQGVWANGCYGNSEIITPNIDKLSSEGMRFNNFFCASPVCSPARASFLTGCIPSQHGIHDWLRDDDDYQASIEYLANSHSYTKILSENGYECALSGKWHMGASYKKQHGFNHWYSHKSGGGPYYGAPMYRNSKLYTEERYITEAITDDALEYLESKKNSETPFYLHVAYTAPHSPWINNHPKKYTELYNNCNFDSVPHLPKNPNSIYLTDEVLKNERDNLIGYYAAVTAMDEGIGRILNKLDEMNITDNTLIIFTSDNGFSCGHHGFWGKGNGTFPINMYEESVKVPFIIKHNKIIPANTVCDELVSAYDFMPTLLEYLDIQYSDNVPRPGISFYNFLKGETSNENRNIFVLDEYGPNRMIRDNRYKYICRYPYGPNELYDLLNDPHEYNNLLKDSNIDTDKIETHMRKELDEWFFKYVDPKIDGAKESVFGCGQIGLAGLYGNGKAAYSCDEYIKEHKNYSLYNDSF